MFNIHQKTSKYMSLVVTHECNKRCEFCVDSYRGSGEFTTLKIVKESLDFAKDNDIEDILIIGGEPTLHPDIIEIAKLVKSYGFRSIMTTNYTKPLIVKALDGIVDCFNISYYNQPNLPNNSEMKSDITIHALINQTQLQTLTKLNEFIDEFKDKAHLKFSTLSPCNEWAKKKQKVEYIDNLSCEWIVLFNEILGQIYRGCVIKRYDRVINNNSIQSYKAHVDGEISTSWERNIMEIVNA